MVVVSSALTAGVIPVGPGQAAIAGSALLVRREIGAFGVAVPVCVSGAIAPVVRRLAAPPGRQIHLRAG